MKSLFKFFFLFSMLLTFFENSYSQVPSYTLQAVNGAYAPDMKSATFDIILTHTDANTFEYAGGMYFFKIPQSFGALGIGTGANSGYQYDSVGGQPVSNFGLTMIPRNPSVVATTINGVPSYELRLAANSLPGAGNGTIIPQNTPWLVIKMKVKAQTGTLNPANGNLLFRDSCQDNPVSVTRTKLNAYIGTANTEITRCANHSVDLNFFPPFPIACNIKLAIEGLYNSSTDKLRKRDTVTAYLRKIISPYQIIDSANSLIDSVTLTGNFNFLIFQLGNYYISIKHRNSLETWSKPGGENFSGTNYSYDFTASSSQAYGNNMILKGNKYCIYSGNVNNDMIIDSDDLINVDNDLFNYAPGSAITNLNADNIVDIDDLAIADKNANQLVLVEWPGLTLDMRKNLSKNKIIAGGIK